MQLLKVADSISLEEVNAIAASVLSYISHYRKEAALLEEVGPDHVAKGYAKPGPSRMTSIVACVPAFMDASGQSTGDSITASACVTLSTGLSTWALNIVTARMSVQA